MIKTYEKYKDSGIIWAEKTPNSWLITKYRYIINILNGYPFKSELFDNEEGFPLLRIRDITSGKIETYYKGDFSDEFIVRKGDLVVGMDGDFNIRWWENEDILLNQRCCSIKVKLPKISLRFLFYVLPNELKVINDLAYYTTVKHLSSNDIYNSKIALPSFSEQTQIVNYLDNQTAIIDELIAKKEKLVELLKEKRQSVINNAVTKGLDPNAKMKDSGIEWLGEVPEEWKKITLRYLTEKVGSGVTPRGGADVYVDEGVIFIRSQNVHFEGLKLDDVVKIEPEVHENMSGSKVEYNDVLLNITGASIGRCCVVDIKEEMNVNQHVCIIRPKKEIAPNYLNLILQSFVGQTQVKLGITGGNREGLTFEAIKDFVIYFPEKSIQLEILKDIENKVKGLNDLESKMIVQIDNLKSYRQSIISEAVTGKIDLRDWKPINN